MIGTKSIPSENHLGQNVHHLRTFQVRYLYLFLLLSHWHRHKGTKTYLRKHSPNVNGTKGWDQRSMGNAHSYVSISAATLPRR